MIKESNIKKRELPHEARGDNRLAVTYRRLFPKDTDTSFTIESIGAQLIEVELDADGLGKYAVRSDGVTVPDGVATTAPIDLATETVRVWRVDGDIFDEAQVTVTDSPFGASITRRRYLVDRDDPALLAHLPWLRLPSTAFPGQWSDGKTVSGDEGVTARGGDLVVVTFATE
jgi:hypothetical protein